MNTGAEYQNAGILIGPPTIPGAVNFELLTLGDCPRGLEVRRVPRTDVDERGDHRGPRLGDEHQGARDARPQLVHLAARGRDRDEALQVRVRTSRTTPWIEDAAPPASGREDNGAAA